MLKGVYLDELLCGRGPRWSSGWRPNAIVGSCDLLLASLLKREEGIEGILYWAAGSGDAAWDATPPAASPETTRLAREAVRVPVAADAIRFVDAAGLPSATLTGRLEITAEFVGDDLVEDGFLPLREFGVFGGDATEDADSGLLVDYVAHPRIDLSRGFVLRRRLRLSFAVGTAPPAAPGDFGAARSVIDVDGVGEVYGGVLAALGVATIGDLARFDPRTPVADIPPVNLLEMCTKARMVLNLQPEPSRFTALAGRTLSSLLLERPESIAVSVPGPGISAAEVSRLQDRLVALQVALNEEVLQQITLSELIPA